MELALVAALGVVAGVIAGLFGVGGGTVFVPTLTLVVGMSVVDAEATSLMYFCRSESIVAIILYPAPSRVLPAATRSFAWNLSKIFPFM